jgi:histidine ammonia-lyase
MTESIVVGLPVTRLSTLRPAADRAVTVELEPGLVEVITAGRKVIERAIDEGQVIYGVNTGFGKLADQRISRENIVELQHRLIRSHQVGVGPDLPDRVVRVALVLKLLSLVQGYSAVRPEVVTMLVDMINNDILPCVPAQGSVGASGDLAPLAHLTSVMLGSGRARLQGVEYAGSEALEQAGLKPLELKAKEALALINGTQISTALCLVGLIDAERAFRAALLAGALSLEGINGNLEPFDERIHRVRRQAGQIAVAAAFRGLLNSSPILTADGPRRTQDMYSFRCQPQVMGAALDLLRFSADLLEREANAVSDNPLVFPEDGVVLSGGNFHAQPVAYAADVLTLALCEVGSSSERRQFVLNDGSLSGLPPFLTREAGLNSGMTMIQVTSAALVAENRSRAFPGSVDNVPTVANQEDHVSMATHTARRVLDVAANTTQIVANELIMAAQAVEMREPLSPGPATDGARALVRTMVAPLEDDRPMSRELMAVAASIGRGDFSELVPIETLLGF